MQEENISWIKINFAISVESQTLDVIDVMNDEVPVGKICLFLPKIPLQNPPPLERNVAIPESADIPAPEKTTQRLEFLISSAAF